jgi:hypothetical protein
MKLGYLKFFIATGGVAASLLAGGCSTTQPRAERWEAPPAGASWAYAQRNTGSYGKDVALKVTRSDTTWQGKPALAMSNSLGMTTMVDPGSGHWMAVVNREGKAMSSWEPPLGFEYPLTVGKSWTTPYRMTLGNGKVVPYELSCSVQSYEKVSVPAGAIDAFKVACTTNIGNEETYWIQPAMGLFVKTSLRRTEKSPFGPGTQEAELTSAPTRP